MRGSRATSPLRPGRRTVKNNGFIAVSPTTAAKARATASSHSTTVSGPALSGRQEGRLAERFPRRNRQSSNSKTQIAAPRSGGFRISGTNGGNVVACAPPLPTVNAMYCLLLTM
jgi:hypothetical protein